MVSLASWTTFATHDIDSCSTRQVNQRRVHYYVESRGARFVPLGKMDCCTSYNQGYKYMTRVDLSITLKRKGHRVPCSLFSSKCIPKRITITCNGSNVSHSTQPPFININLAFEHQTECVQTRSLIKKSLRINLKTPDRRDPSQS